jgi:hypothetical protein
MVRNLAYGSANLDDSISSPGFYDTQKAIRDTPDCRGRLRTDKDGKYSYRAVVPVSYPIPADVSHFKIHSIFKMETLPDLIMYDRAP